MPNELLHPDEAFPKPERFSPRWIDELVSHHIPDEQALDRISEVRVAAAHFLSVMVNHCPDCADRAAAIRKVREAMMTANAAIVLGGMA